MILMETLTNSLILTLQIKQMQNFAWVYIIILAIVTCFLLENKVKMLIKF